MLADVWTCFYKYLQMFTDIYTCLQMFTNVYRCLHMFTHVYRCLQMFTNVYTCLHMFTNVCRWFLHIYIPSAYVDSDTLPYIRPADIYRRHGHCHAASIRGTHPRGTRSIYRHASRHVLGMAPRIVGKPLSRWFLICQSCSILVIITNMSLFESRRRDGS